MREKGFPKYFLRAVWVRKKGDGIEEGLNKAVAVALKEGGKGGRGCVGNKKSTNQNNIDKNIES